MKSIKYFLIISLLFFMSACDEDKYLDLYPLTSITEGSFYNTLDEFEQAVNDVYRQLGRLADAQSIPCLYGELFSDNTYIAFQLGGTPVDDPISKHEIRTDNARIGSAWNNTYNAIYILNGLIEKIENTEVQINENLKSRWIAEALTVRSYAYFNLVRAFGAVPLLTKKVSPVESYDYLRESPETVYQQIITDLNYAKSNLPANYSGTDVGRVTKYSASAILSKVYLTMGNNSAAQTELKLIIDSNQFSLDANGDGIINIEDYLYLFKPLTKNSKSSVFEAQYLAGANAANSNHQFAYSPYHWAFNLPGIENQPFRGGGVNSPTADLSEEFEKGDPRKEISVRQGYINQGTGDFIYYPHTLKFYDPVWEYTGQNFEIIRYADILLMYAEVTKNTEYLNMVRGRVGLPLFGSKDYPSDLYPTLELAIEHERRMELCLEMHRFFDLVRTGRVSDVMSTKKELHPGFRSDRILFPIPQQAIDVNPGLTQNPGY